MNQEQAEILGAFIGDGWIEKRGNALYITGSVSEDREYYDTHLSLIFSKNFINVIPKEFPYWKVYGISTYKKRIVCLAKDLGFTTGKKADNVKIPDYIMENSDIDLISSVLRGIFDTDGSFFCKKDYQKYGDVKRKKYHCIPRIVISSNSPKLISQIKELSEKFNIFGIVRKIRGKGIKSNRNCNASYIFEINKLKDIDGWFKLIRPKNPRHLTKYKIWLKYGFLPPFTNIEQRMKILKGKLSPYSFY